MRFPCYDDEQVQFYTSHKIDQAEKKNSYFRLVLIFGLEHVFTSWSLSKDAGHRWILSLIWQHKFSD